MKAHIMVGFTEGKWHEQRMRKQLRQRGIDLTKNYTDADYIIAHSGGCYNVPPLQEHQVLLLINPTYWPGKTIRERARTMTLQVAQSIRPGNEPLYHLNKTLHNTAYFGIHLARNLAMIKQAESFNLEQEIKHSNTILVRNDGDPWLTPQLDQLQSLNPHLQIVRLEGEHDDCWQHPKAYIELLQSYERV